MIISLKAFSSDQLRPVENRFPPHRHFRRHLPFACAESQVLGKRQYGVPIVAAAGCTTTMCVSNTSLCFEYYIPTLPGKEILQSSVSRAYNYLVVCITEVSCRQSVGSNGGGIPRAAHGSKRSHLTWCIKQLAPIDSMMRNCLNLTVAKSLHNDTCTLGQK